MEIITRNKWGARPIEREPGFVRMADRTEFIVHHSAGPVGQSVKEIQAYHIDVRRFIDIGYNFLVRGNSGQIYLGRGWNQIGAHTVGHNTTGLGVCVIGTDLLTEQSKASLRYLYRQACLHSGQTLTIHGHRQLDETLCPGAKISRWIHSGELSKAQTLPVLSLARPYAMGEPVRIVQRKVGAKVDGIYGPATEKAVRTWQSTHHLVVDGIVGPETWHSFGDIS